jgi:hypothetical protein
VGGEGVGDRQGGRLIAKTTTVIPLFPPLTKGDERGIC